MATNFSEIIDLSLITIRDYKIDRLYRDDETAWEEFLTGFIVRAIPLFKESKTSLEYDLENKTFINTLSIYEKNILSIIVNYIWLEREVNNVSQFSITMTPNDFKRHSEAQNLREKSEYLDRIREKYNQEIVNYSIDNIDYEKWGNGIFG